MLWSAAVLSNIYPDSHIKVPCSAYSLSVKLAHSVDYWDTDAHSIGEDMHMYLKCFFSTQGHLKNISIYSPASQCNVQGSSYIKGIQDRYAQAKRHMWGSLDSGYMIRRICFGILAPGYDSLSKNEVQKVALVRPPAFQDDNSASGLIRRIPVLLHRMAEAHIAMGQVFFMVGVTTLFPMLAGSHPYVVLVTWLGGWIRAIFGLTFVAMLFFYEKYHRFVSEHRWTLSMQEQLHAGSGEGVQPLGKRSQLRSVRQWYSIFDWAWLPVCGILYLVIPQIHAHIIHLFTDKLIYTVAGKPHISTIHSLPDLQSVIVNSISNNSLATTTTEEGDANSVNSRGDSGFYDFDGVKGPPYSPKMWGKQSNDELEKIAIM